MKNKLTDISKEEADQLLASNPGVIVLAPVVTKEEILGRIWRPARMSGDPSSGVYVSEGGCLDQDKLAELLMEIMNKTD